MSLEAECQSQGAGWHNAHTSHPGWGGLSFWNPQGSALASCQAQGRWNTPSSCSFSKTGGITAAGCGQLCLGSHHSAGADRLCSWASCPVSLNLSPCKCEMGVTVLSPRGVVRED